MTNRALSRIVTAAIAVALVGTTAGTALADGPAVPPAAQLSIEATARTADFGTPTGSAPQLAVNALAKNGQLYYYQLNGKGGLTARKAMKSTAKSRNAWKQFKMVAQRHTSYGDSDGVYMLHNTNDVVYKTNSGFTDVVGTKWGMYDTLFSPGNLGGSRDSDLLARDKSGVLWVYKADIIGKLSARKKVGGGWGQFTQITGRGDLNGDGRTDIVARDKKGVLWLYKGTGDINKPFAGRSKVSGGWNKYNLLVATGDVDGDRRSDLLARDKGGVMWLFKGTGKQAAPFGAPVKLGGGWNEYRLVF
ncbi:VCBS repeat-containing protein [Streptomyces sp. AV19]|uniref:FG-GAP repeat domain-containing protein n=1 Tax=Streptomyces sp. AV19 TaxID=2793068 RepID=UPI002412F4B1|nr:VCBS repeat-containing protein [Streptomyces sp. AV19]MDG4535135.1 VCBS repeat-containing protein [Streptomyces sp. AV19]